jgi:ABC-2 type transport system ATP-binding protein
MWRVFDLNLSPPSLHLIGAFFLRLERTLPASPASSMDPDTPIMRARNVTKRYGDLRAVDDVSLDIFPGEIFALLGPNGAGKTTLIGCITGLTSGFEGTIEVAGRNVVDDYRVTRRLVGLVPQEINYDAFFTVRDSLRYQGGYFGVSDEDRVHELLEQFALTDKIDETSRHLSGGMQRRLMICKALMHDPVLLFLDEPTAGVDVELRDELWRYVRRLRDRGTTIVLTTHYLEEAEQLADRIGIIEKGALVRVDPRDELLEEFGERKLEVTLTAPPPDAFREIADKVGAEIDGAKVIIRFQGDSGRHPANDLLRAIYEHDLEVDEIESKRSSLEEVFRQLVYQDEEGA